MLAILAYFELRALPPVDIPRAVRLTVHLIDIEKTLHLFVEPRMQSFTLQHELLRRIADSSYSYLHFPALAGMGVVLWFRKRSQFVLVRNTLYASMVIGLVFYYAIPAAPPRLMAFHGYDYGFVDTVFGTSSRTPYPSPSFFVNDYAAIPSFHFGWIALAAWGLWTSGVGWSLKVTGIVLTVVMAWACAVTANHLMIDMAMGLIVVAAAWAIAKYAWPWIAAQFQCRVGGDDTR